MWEKHYAALALYFAYYNFYRMHKTLRCTPGMAQGAHKISLESKGLTFVGNGILVGERLI
jgi:hypothetical protein